MAFAVLFLAFFALRASPAGIDKTPDPDHLSDLEPCDRGAHLLDDSHDLMSRHHGEDRAAPFIPSLVHVRMTNPAVANADKHVLPSHVSS
jgi:hypothetical protein